MSQPSIKLYYFNFRALAEPTRIMLAYGGIPYEDVRVTDEDWPALKPTMPMAQMPVLEVGDKRIFQSVTIARYVAKRVGLAGKDDLEAALIDGVVDTIVDFRSKMELVYFYEKDEAVKAKKGEELKKDVVPFYLDKFEALAQENNGYLAFGKLTWADIVLTTVLDLIQTQLDYDLTAETPNLKKVVANVSSVDSIKTWIEKRPKTEF